MELLAALVAKKNCSVILTTHDPMVQLFAKKTFIFKMGSYTRRGLMFLFLALRNLFRNSRRTLAILFTIVLGKAGTLFSFDGFINGVLNELQYSTIHSNYGYGQINTKTLSGNGVCRANGRLDFESRGSLPLSLSYRRRGADFSESELFGTYQKGQCSCGGIRTGSSDKKGQADFFHSLNVEEGETLKKPAKRHSFRKRIGQAFGLKPGETVTGTSDLF